MSPQALTRLGQPTRRRRLVTDTGEVILCALVMCGAWGLFFVLGVLVER